MQAWIIRLAVGACAVSFLAHTARAGIFSTFNLMQVLGCDYSAAGVDKSLQVNDQILPYHYSASLSTGYGGTVSATYDAYDNGTAAGFSIQATDSTTATGNYVGELTNTATTFSFTQPVNYTISVYATGIGSDGTGGGGRVYSSLVDPELNLAEQNGVQYTFTGTAIAGPKYDLDEYFEFNNTNTGSQYADVYGNESIVFTFTAVPEPSFLTLVTACSTALSRRWSGSRHRRLA